jgi:hypothetical protein
MNHAPTQSPRLKLTMTILLSLAAWATAAFSLSMPGERESGNEECLPKQLVTQFYAFLLSLTEKLVRAKPEAGCMHLKLISSILNDYRIRASNNQPHHPYWHVNGLSAMWATLTLDMCFG